MYYYRSSVACYNRSMDRRTVLLGSLGFGLPGAFAFQAPGKSVCLMIGVEKYSNSRVSSLQYAAKDVTAVAKVLETKFGFTDVRVLTTDATNEKDKPTSTNVIKAVNQLVQILEPADSLVFYFSGHGIVRDGKTYLATQDADPSDPLLLDRSTVSLELLQAKLKRLKARQVILILDACRNDPDKGKGDSDNKRSALFSKDLVSVAENVSSSSGGSSAILFACSEGERAYEEEEFGHSVFTKFLLDGLNGKASSFSVDDVVAYASDQVRKWARDNGNKQSPDLQKFGTGKLSFGSVEIAPKPVDLKVEVAPVLIARISTARFGSAAAKLRDKYPRLADYVESLCVIPAGEFQRGSTKYTVEQPVHKVSLSSFGLGATPVTVALWKEYSVAKLSGVMPPETNPVGFDGAKKFNVGWKDVDHPIVNISWDDCRKFSVWASEVSGVALDLPSEAQWEYACRGGVSSLEFPWGGATDDVSVRNFLTTNVWCSDAKVGDRGGTGSVNRTNRIWRNHPWGLVDMVGNVWEWCIDYYDPEWYGRPQATVVDVVNRTSAPTQTFTFTDGTKIDAASRCVRGGSWLNSYPEYFRCAYRNKLNPDFGYNLCGIRLSAGPS
jgi:formylglycine-generating enzyme required for sulfatase activity